MASGMRSVWPAWLRRIRRWEHEQVIERLVQEFLGHKTPAMTMHYTAVSPKRLSALRVGLAEIIDDRAFQSLHGELLPLCSCRHGRVEGIAETEPCPLNE